MSDRHLYRSTNDNNRNQPGRPREVPGSSQQAYSLYNAAVRPYFGGDRSMQQTPEGSAHYPQEQSTLYGDPTRTPDQFRSQPPQPDVRRPRPLPRPPVERATYPPVTRATERTGQGGRRGTDMQELTETLASTSLETTSREAVERQLIYNTRPDGPSLPPGAAPPIRPGEALPSKKVRRRPPALDLQRLPRENRGEVYEKPQAHGLSETPQYLRSETDNLSRQITIQEAKVTEQISFLEEIRTLQNDIHADRQQKQGEWNARKPILENDFRQLTSEKERLTGILKNTDNRLRKKDLKAIGEQLQRIEMDIAKNKEEADGKIATLKALGKAFEKAASDYSGAIRQYEEHKNTLDNLKRSLHEREAGQMVGRAVKTSDWVIE